MELKDFFREHDRLALAFSGGADSAYLMYAAVKNGADITAYYVRSQFQPEFEYQDALRLADELGVRLRVLNADVLSDDNIASNPPERCYHCKKRIMGLIKSAAARDGYDVIIDGTNASDDGADRPGMRVLREYGILSPLRRCGAEAQRPLPHVPVRPEDPSVQGRDPSICTPESARRSA